MSAGVRFVRINGHVVPLHSAADKKTYEAGRKAGQKYAASGAALVAAGALEAASLILRKESLMTAAAGTSLLGAGLAIKGLVDFNKAKKGKGPHSREAQIASAAGSKGALVGIVGSFAGRGIGFRAGVKAFPHMMAAAGKADAVAGKAASALRPHADKLIDAIRFARAKKVSGPAVDIARKLLAHS